MPEKELRTYPIRELRAAGDDQKPVIDGYAAVFDEFSEDLGGFIERIAPGAFTETLKSADVRALWNHNSDYPLGRTKSGTLKLGEDKRGLAFEVQVPDTQYGRDLVVSMKRGDVDQMSFAFGVKKDNWEQVDGQVIRTLLEVELYDVSPVTYPAYPQTSAAVRSQLEKFSAGGQAADQQAREKAKAQARNRNRQRKLHIQAIR
jgi:HK97 family phage prohead protease